MNDCSVHVFEPKKDRVNLALREIDGRVFLDAVDQDGKHLGTVLHITRTGAVRRHALSRRVHLARDSKGRVLLGKDYGNS